MPDRERKSVKRRWTVFSLNYFHGCYINPEESFNSLFKAILHSVSWVRKPVNTRNVCQALHGDATELYPSTALSVTLTLFTDNGGGI